MKRILSISVLLFAAVGLFAQITVTNATFPVAGDVLHMAIDNSPTGFTWFTPPGGSQTWDFTNLQVDATQNLTYSPASQGTQGANVPSAELFTVLSPNTETYYNVTPTNFELLAYWGIVPYDLVANNLFNYNPPLGERFAPLNFFDIRQSSSGFLEFFIPSDFPAPLMAALPVSPDSLRYRVAINQLYTVDAWGTASIPGGTYDVLREKRTKYTETRIDGKIPPLGWLDITDIAIQAGFQGLGVDTMVSYNFFNNVVKEPIAVLTLNNAQNALVKAVFRNVNSNCPTGNVLYVKANATGANNGTSWTDAFTDLQSALANTCPGITQIWVAAGTYKPTATTDRTISFLLKNGIAIYGGFNGTETMLSQRNWTTNQTILSGDIGAAGNADNSYTVIKGTGTNNTAILDGFTITGGNANGTGFYTNSERNGGGMYNGTSSSPTVRNCHFTGNSASAKGGGIFNIGANCSPILTNCAFTNNSASNGGGVANQETRVGTFPSFTNCSFFGNTGTQGGGMLVDSASTAVTNCIFWGNSTGVFFDNSASGTSFTIKNSIIQGGCPAGATCTSVLNVDPLFVDAPAGNLHLQACSPAINSGTATGAPSTDYDNEPRPSGGGFDMGYDEFSGVTFTLPANGAATVACPAQATQPTPPAVTTNLCNQPVTMTGPAIGATPACEGTKTFTWTYSDGFNTLPWVFTYTIEREDFTIPANGAATVACPANATQPIPPMVADNCGQLLNSVGPVIGATPACEGTKTYTWTYTDCEGNSHPWVFTYTIERNDFAVPANGAATVACLALATEPVPPTVQSNCGETIIPSGPLVVDNPNPLTCEGTRTYTWTYMDCEGNSHSWSYVYTIERNDFAVPGNGAATVSCPALATEPTPPTVQSNCGETITPSGPLVFENPNPLTCEGTRTYTWTYTDCEGNSHPWSFVYTVIRLDFTVPANGASTVSCPALATAPIPPTVLSNCGQPITPTGPIVVENPNPLTCEGTRTYTWTYTDCAGHTHPWAFTYTIERNDFTVPANGSATVACPAQAISPVPPVVFSNCGEPITPTGPVIGATPACEGTKTYTFTYTDCEGNSHPWVFTYTIERNDFAVPANGSATVGCPAQAIQPVPPTVLSDCGETIIPTGPTVVNNPNPILCVGTRTFTWTYTDCEGNSHPWSFVYNIVPVPFNVPPNGAATVACPALATQPTPPVVLDACGNPTIPTGPVIVNNPNPISCEGTRTYTWTYTDCAGNMTPWSFVYTIERIPFTVPTNGASTVACPSQIVQPVPPVVLSNCGEVLTPTGPVIVNNPNPITCEGTRTFTWTYTDCEGNTAQWSHVTTVERLPFSVPANGGATVSCPDQTDVQPTPPVVTSNCGEVLTPVVSATPKPGCEGNRNWNFVYTDCEGNTATWSFIYTVEYQDFNLPPNENYNVECPLNASQPVPPVVYDNCGKLLNPIGPIITKTTSPTGCEASRQYAWKYSDCEGNNHVWSVTYHFQYTSDFYVYPDQVDYVACLDFAQPPIPPTIYDNCGQEISASGPIVTEEISEGGCLGVRTFTYIYTDCGGHSHEWSFIYYANDDEPPMGNCPSGTVNSVDENNLSCIEDVPCPNSFDFSEKIAELLAAGHFYDLCSGNDLVVSLDSWSALWECSDPDGDGHYTFGRTFYFSIADQCGNEYPGLCAVTYSGSCQPIVTFPQSTWGLEDETSNIDLGVIQHLLDAYGPLKVGGNVRSLTLTDAQCVADLLPGQGGPDQLADCHQVNCTGCNPAGPNGMKNLLAANAIALQLSLRYSVEYNGANMPGMLAQSLGCIQLDPNIVSCTPTCKLRIFDQQGMQHFYPYTLGGLIDLVNFYLGGNVNLSVGQAGVYGTALNNALDAVTANWGGQPSPTSCDPNPGVTGNPVVDKALPKVKLNPAVDLKEELGLDLFPNPTSGKVTARLQGFGQAGAQLTVFDRLGRVVLQQKIGEGTEQLDLDFSRKEFAAGEYFVRVVSGNGTLTKKMMVAK